MFRPIQKKKNELSTEDTKQILREARRGVLAVNGEDGYPYAIPINFIYDETAGRIYFHSSRTGYKLDAIKVCDKVCFTATEQKSSARKHGRPICGAPWYSAAAACWKVPRRPWRC